MKYLILIIFLIITSIYINFANEKPVYVVSSYPAKMILQEIVGDKVEIHTLISVGASPHTFSPKPSQMKKLQQADCFFYIADNMDNWAKKIQAKKKVILMDMVPKSKRLSFEDEAECTDHGHNHKHSHKKSDIDPHFWTDPITVKSMLPNLLKKLNELNPELSDVFKTGAEKFSKKLDDLNSKVILKISKYKGENIFLFHPSFLYYLKQYGLNYGGAIETSPGKEPSSKSTITLIKKIKKSKAKALYSEPQLPESPVKAIAEASGLKIFTLDPLGGIPGREQYFEYIMYNTNIFVKSFE